MSKRQELKKQYYMVRLSGGQWSPKAKHETLAEAIKEAARLSKQFGKPATILESAIRVETLGDLVNMEEVRPNS